MKRLTMTFSFITLLAFMFVFTSTSQAGVGLGRYAGAAAEKICSQYSGSNVDACRAYLKFRIDLRYNKNQSQFECEQQHCNTDAGSSANRNSCWATCTKMLNNDN
jgi:hypothetical protein